MDPPSTTLDLGCTPLAAKLVSRRPLAVVLFDGSVSRKAATSRPKPIVWDQRGDIKQALLSLNLEPGAGVCIVDWFEFEFDSVLLAAIFDSAKGNVLCEVKCVIRNCFLFVRYLYGRKATGWLVISLGLGLNPTIGDFLRVQALDWHGQCRLCNASLHAPTRLAERGAGCIALFLL